MIEEDLKEIIADIEFAREQNGSYLYSYLYFKVSAIENLVNENKHLLDLQKQIDKDYEELQSRIDKALNKLEKLYSFNYNDRLTCDEIRNTLLILKGSK